MKNTKGTILKDMKKANFINCIMIEPLAKLLN
jgi:hypothetical protein